MKTKSAVRPREIQSTVLNLKRLAPGVKSRVKVANIRLLNGTDVVAEGYGCEKLHYPVAGVFRCPLVM